MKLFTVCMKLTNSNGFSTSDVTGEYNFLKNIFLTVIIKKGYVIKAVLQVNSESPLSYTLLGISLYIF